MTDMPSKISQNDILERHLIPLRRFDPLHNATTKELKYQPIKFSPTIHTVRTNIQCLIVYMIECERTYLNITNFELRLNKCTPSILTNTIIINHN